MQISASMVKELRDRTGAGMMDCKKALQETAGDIEAAIDAMRKSGVAKAAKKAGRIAAEGTIVIERGAAGSQAVILEVNCETDFVARDENFQKFSRELASTLLEQGNGPPESLADLPLNGTEARSVEEARQELVAKLGENISIRRHARVRQSRGRTLGIYVHGIRIGVIVDLSTDNPVLAKDLAMHIAAANPLCVDEQDVPRDVLEKEREIQLAHAGQSGKPEHIVEKMVDGRVKKFIKENTLLGQAFVKDPDMSVADLLKTNNARVNGFTRYEVGEGLEKKADNFAAEVMQQGRSGLGSNRVLPDVPELRYRRILIKLSGEALMGDAAYGINPATIKRLANEIRELGMNGAEIALVLGAGNFFRGSGLAASGIDRVTADHMGMLATIMNSLALQDALEQLGSYARVMSAIKINEVCEDYIRRRAVRHLEKGRVVIFAAGTGNPFFTTDSAASLRAVEINADLLIKATKVDGVYSADPVRDKSAIRYDVLSYDDVIERKLAVMDTTAIVLCRENNMPLRVLNMMQPGALLRSARGMPEGTLVTGFGEAS